MTKWSRHSVRTVFTKRSARGLQFGRPVDRGGERQNFGGGACRDGHQPPPGAGPVAFPTLATLLVRSVRRTGVERRLPWPSRDAGSRREHGGKTRRQLWIARSPISCNYPKVHGRGVEPLRLAAAEPKAALAAEDSRRIEKTGPTTDPSGPEIGGVHPGVGQSWGNPASLGTGTDQVEAALARALDRASEAGRFDVVAQLARELEARRLARLPNLVPLEPDGRGKRKP